MSSVTELNPGAHIHLMGICGTAMGSLAGLLQKKGFKITGSDENVYPPMSTQLEDLGIEIKKGFIKENLNPCPDFVIVGNVMTKKMEEVQALLESNIPYSSLPKTMGELFLKDRESVVCCGTHGKTTITSMMAWALECLEQKPGYLIGGVPLNFSKSFSARDSKWFAIEGDEYDTAFFNKVPKFVHYYPKNVILTGVEFDHVDIYKDLDAVMNAFQMLLEKIPDDGVLVYNGEDQNIKDLLSKKDYKFWKLSYGQSQECHSQLLEEEFVEEGARVCFKIGDREFEFVGNWFGTYNSLNFLSAMTLLDFKGMDLDKVVEAAQTFKGVARRQQKLFDNDQIKVFEDFAHHPSAVKLTLESFKKRYPGKNLIAVFEPRSATSRKEVFQKDYISSFAAADCSVIAPVSKKGEADVFSSKQLVDDINKSGNKALYYKSLEDIPQNLYQELTGNDVIVFMSNGSFGGIHKIFVDQVETKFV